MYHNPDAYRWDSTLPGGGAYRLNYPERNGGLCGLFARQILNDRYDLNTDACNDQECCRLVEARGWVWDNQLQQWLQEN